MRLYELVFRYGPELLGPVTSSSSVVLGKYGFSPTYVVLCPSPTKYFSRLKCSTKILGEFPC